MMAGTRTIYITGVAGLVSPLVCVTLLLSAVPGLRSELSFSSHKENNGVVDLSSPYSHNSRLDKSPDQQGAFEIQQSIYNDFNSHFRPPLDRLSQVWRDQFGRRGIPHLRRRRAVTQETMNQTVPESQLGVLVNFPQKLLNTAGRRFSLNSSSVNPEMFELTSGGVLSLRSGYRLDYEDSAMRSITMVVHAVSTSDPTDVVEITATLFVTDVDEAPVFTTEPQPFLATIRANSGAGYTIITLVAEDPEGAPVSYSKISVSPNQYEDRIEVRMTDVGNVRQCEIRTVGTANFDPDTITINVAARDRDTGGKEVTTTVSVLVGLRPPQFYSSSYQGAILENNDCT
ncbi:uncharacterized protein [Littorina saxatilis]|uniref:uncharacterized protein n=1 Tax=Littorina saxatilis TaxID=31220 RepID=UPI0038B51169